YCSPLWVGRSGGGSLAEDVFAIAALCSVLNAAQHLILELAFGGERNPFVAADAVNETFEPSVDTHLRSAWRCRVYLHPQHIPAAPPVTDIARGEIGEVKQLTSGGNTYYEDDWLAYECAFPGGWIAVLFVHGDLARLEHLLGDPDNVIAGRAKD